MLSQIARRTGNYQVAWVIRSASRYRYAVIDVVLTVNWLRAPPTYQPTALINLRQSRSIYVGCRVFSARCHRARPTVVTFCAVCRLAVWRLTNGSFVFANTFGVCGAIGASLFAYPVCVFGSVFSDAIYVSEVVFSLPCRNALRIDGVVLSLTFSETFSVCGVVLPLTLKDRFTIFGAIPLFVFAQFFFVFSAVSGSACLALVMQAITRGFVLMELIARLVFTARRAAFQCGRIRGHGGPPCRLTG